MSFVNLKIVEAEQGIEVSIDFDPDLDEETQLDDLPMSHKVGLMVMGILDQVLTPVDEPVN